MKYRWDKRVIFRLLRDSTTRKELDSLLSFALDPLHLFDGEKHSMKSIILWDADYLTDNDFLLNPISEVSPSQIVTDDSNGFSKHISNNDTISLIHDFYQSLDNDTFKLFLKVFKTRRSHLQFAHPLCNSTYSGQTFACPSSKDTFISITSDETLNDSEIGVHEYGHAISFLKNNFAYSDESKTPFSEVESIFFELLALDYYAKIPGLRSDCNTYRSIYIRSLLEDIDTILLKMDITSVLFDNINSSFAKLYDKLEEELSIDRKDLKDACKSSAQNMIPYVMSGIIALRLYSIYQINSDYAMRLYNFIVTLKMDDPYSYFECLEKLTNRSNEDIESFCRKLKR